MASERITVRVPKIMETRLREHSRARGQTPSDLVRMALESFLGSQGKSQSAYEMAKKAGLIGCVRRAPKDLSVNPQFMKDFGTR